MPGKWWPIAPNAPTKRKISWALHRAWAAVKIGISNTGVPTKRSRSRHRSRIHIDGLFEGPALDLPPAGTLDAIEFAGRNVCVAISSLNNSSGPGKQARGDIVSS